MEDTCRVQGLPKFRGAPRIRIMEAATSSNFKHFEDEESVGAGQFKATSPDLTLNGGLYRE